MRAVELSLVIIASVFLPTASSAQENQSSKAYALRGCWKVEVGTFRMADSIHVDRGQTTLPPFIQFDTVPGRGLFRPTGHLVRALPDRAGSQYRTGYFTFPRPDTVEVNWTNGFTGVTLTFPSDTDVMRGRADAWTDYGGAEWAPVTIRRTVCPT
jgi:hypothetical protein